MTVTIGSLTFDTLTAQPYGYEETSTYQGLTATHWRISGLLTPTQWQSFLSVYDTWRDARINDQDTLLSQAVGTTVSVSATANGFTKAAACWYVNAPTGEQVGRYVEASAIVVDAAEALEVLLEEVRLQNERQQAEEALVDCNTIAADLRKRKAETDCELTALQTGLADDFAEQDVLREKIDKQAALTARAPDAALLAGLDLEQERQDAEARESAYTTGSTDLLNLRNAKSNIELLDKQATLSGRSSYATSIAAVDLDQQVQDIEAQEAAYTAGTTDLQNIKDAESHIELLDKQANLAGRSTYANPIAVVDLDQEKQDIEAQEYAYANGSTDLVDIKDAESHIELMDKQANLTGRSTYAVPIAAVDLDQQVQDIEAQEAAYAAGSADLVDIKNAESHIELMEKTATLSGRAPYANDIAEADLLLERQDIEAKAFAYVNNGDVLVDIKDAEIDIELAQNTAQITAYAAELETLKASRSLLSLYESYINENLPNLGTVSYGATIYLTKPAETRTDGPTIGFTAAGKSLISGPLTSHVTYDIEGYLAIGSSPSDVLTWYDGRLTATSGAFPTSAPTFTAEPFLVSGVKGTRYSVSMTVVELV